ncbi:MAG: alpha/beta hydrolase-fold protein [Bryobacterales bacterium]|jgi:predicted alpha/beta superfamily hydrolase|nr:alpha/beta hydrolase-fold protein [Bryobacterales bacterium]
MVRSAAAGQSGRLHVQQDFASRYLAGVRCLRIYLPEEYRHTRRRYPVLYFQDGQNLFDPSTAFLGQNWNLHHTLDLLVRQGAVHPLILVGIDNAGVARMDEYTPTRSAAHGHGGKARRYCQMLLREVKPWVDAHYRTLPDAEHTGLGGSSLGGLVTLYAGLRFPRVFGRLAAMSPSVWWDGRVILRYGMAFRGSHRPQLWLDTGGKEGDTPQQVIADTRTLRAVLVNKGWREGVDLRYVEDPEATHHESAWGRRAGPMLHALFPAQPKESAPAIW